MRNDDFQASMELSYFLFNREDPERTQTDTIVYFDHHGIRYEKHISKHMVEEALGKISAPPKAIERSSGGMISAHPTKLFVYTNFHDSSRENIPEIRIRVRFLDFLREADAPLGEEKYGILTKDVLPSDIDEAFSYLITGQQRFVVDFGFGIIPVYICDYRPDDYGNIMAVFTNYEQLKKVSKGDPSKQTEIQCYKASRGVLRIANKLEFEMAKQRLKQLKHIGEEVFPSCLKFGPPLVVPMGFPLAIMRDILSRSIAQYTKGRGDDVFAYMEGI